MNGEENNPLPGKLYRAIKKKDIPLLYKYS